MTFEELQAAAHRNAVEKGFWDSPNLGEKLALIHGEVSELMEAYRKGTEGEPCGKADLTNEEEEFADIALRLMDLAGHRGIDLATAIEKKHAYNLTRPHKHGKLF